MSEFYVGQEVVAVGFTGPGLVSAHKLGGITQPTLGQHCIIRAIGPTGGIMLEGFKNRNGPAGREWDWTPRAFRPIKSETIEIFKEMCRTVKRNVDA